MGPHQPASVGKLNVFLHGTFAFYETANSFTAFAPLLEHHVFRAGNWLGETELQGGEYTLTGVDDTLESDDFALSVSNNLLIRIPDRDRVAAAEPLPHIILRFPRPLSIASLRVASIRKSQFLPEAAQAEFVSASDTLHVATLQILTFDILDEANLRLRRGDGPAGHFWEPVFSGDFVNLHIFAQEDHHERPSFAASDLLATLRILGSKIEKIRGVLIAKGIASGDPIPDGVKPEETEDLAPRTRRMARLGRLVLQKGDPNQAWYRNDALDDDPPACGGSGGKG
jgi:hypothetical protein